MEFRFENTQVKADSRELIVDGEPVHMEPQAFDVLLYLLQHRNRVVSKDELLDNIWGTRHVSESALSSRIKQLRKAVGDSGREQRVIRTLHGKGFRLTAEVREESEDTLARDRTSPDIRTTLTSASSSPSLTSAKPAQVVPELSVRSNLPVRNIGLIGRDAEIVRAIDRLDNGQLLTVVGPGGVGKTTFAVELGHRVVNTQFDQVVFCELASVTEENVADAVLGAFDDSAGSGEVTAAQIIDRIGELSTLLVLDNCEHVIDTAVELCEALLSRGTKLTILATSRELFGIPQESIVRLDGLGCSQQNTDAIDLFVRRARQMADIDIETDDYDAVRSIVELLDGLPLAIELSVPRLLSISLSELELELRNAAPEITKRRGRLDRQSTMERTVQWSYDLLSPQEQKTLRELCIFAGAFSSEAVSAVVSTTQSTQQLQRLIEQSVVTRVPQRIGTRYRLLEPIKQHIARLLGGSEMGELQHRHAEYFALSLGNIAKGLRSGDETTFAERLTREWRDINTALAWARENRRQDLAVEPILSVGFHLIWQLRVEAFSWLEEAVQCFGKEVAERPEVKVLRGLGAWTARDLDRAQAMIMHESHDENPDSQSMFAQFCYWMGINDYERLVPCAERFRAVADGDLDSTWSEVAIPCHLVAQCALEPNSEKVGALETQVHNLLASTNWPTGRCFCALSLLSMHSFRGEDVAASHYLEEVNKQSRQALAPWFAMTAGGFAAMMQQRLRPVETLEHATHSLKTAYDTNELIQIPIFLRILVSVLVELGRLQSAATVLGFVPRIRGMGDSGRFTPGFDEAVAVVRTSVDPDRLDGLLARGSSIEIADVVAIAEQELERAKNKSTNPQPVALNEGVNGK